MKTVGSLARVAVAAIGRRPGRALAICVPLLAVSVFVGTTVASARPEPTLAVSSAELNAAPVPLVRTFAQVPARPAVRSQVRTRMKAPVKTQVKTYKHAQRIPEAWNIDGCDHDYGTPDQCVPWKIPASSGQAACAWLKANGFGPLKVVGTNRQHLPEDAQGYVCAGQG